MRLKDKVAVITGASAGIGRATAIRFAAEGAVLSLWDVNEQRGNELVTELESTGAKARFFKVDTSDMDHVTAATKSTVEAFGRIDILINNAGITRDATLMKMTEEQWDQVIDINLKGAFFLCQSVLEDAPK